MKNLHTRSMSWTRRPFATDTIAYALRLLDECRRDGIPVDITHTRSEVPGNAFVAISLTIRYQGDDLLRFADLLDEAPVEEDRHD